VLLAFLAVLGVRHGGARLHFTKSRPLPDGVTVKVLKVPEDCATWDANSLSADGDTLHVHYVRRAPSTPRQVDDGIRLTHYVCSS